MGCHKLKIAITGAAGLIGSTLGLHLTNKGHTVVGVDNLTGGLPENRLVFGKSFHCVDCNNTETLQKIFERTDVLVDCAATAYEGLSVFSPAYISQNVFQSSVSSITAALASSVRHIVYFSSMARYGAGRAPFKETDQPTPIDPYGIAKYSVEQMLACLKRYHDFEYTVIVPHNVYGPRQRYYDPFRNVISLTINRILLGLPPVVYGNGNQKRSFTYINDLVPPVVHVIENGTYDRQTFNVGSPPNEGVSILELYERICSSLNYRGKYTHEISRPNEVAEAICDVSLVKREFGFASSTCLENGILDCVQFIKNCGPKPFQFGAPIEISNSQIPNVWREHRTTVGRNSYSRFDKSEICYEAT